jgi:glyceraldehyde-3-phosphate dehydrogenase (NAD(P))
MPRNIVHIIGAGTIGVPLAGILAGWRKSLGIEEVTFQPDLSEIRNITMVKGLASRGAKLCVPDEFADEFASAGCKIDYSADEAIRRAGVIIDCSKPGRATENKARIYSRYANNKLFIAQSRDPGFGKDYAYDINDSALVHGEDRYLRIVSCNAHNIASIVKTIGVIDNQSDIESGRFVCIRRANDISEEENFISSPKVDPHKDELYGTYQALDAAALFKSVGLNVDLFSSTMKVNSQYLHIIHFDIRLKTATTLQTIINRFQANPLIALTNKALTSQVAAFSRDMGYLGRVLNQSVVSVPTLNLRNSRELTGFCYSLQDGNSILSSVAAAIWFFFPRSYKEKLLELKDLIFDEI